VSLGIVKGGKMPLPASSTKRPAGFTQPKPKLIVATVYRPKGE